MVSIRHTPRCSLHTNAKEDIVQEEKRHRCRGDFVGVRVALKLIEPNKNCDDQITKGLASCGKNQHIPPSPFLHVRDANERKEEIRDTVTGGEKSSHFLVQTNRGNENSG